MVSVTSSKKFAGVLLLVVRCDVKGKEVVRFLLQSQMFEIAQSSQDFVFYP